MKCVGAKGRSKWSQAADASANGKRRTLASRSEKATAARRVTCNV